jgi:hypothetical protein
MLQVGTGRPGKSASLVANRRMRVTNSSTHEYARYLRATKRRTMARIGEPVISSPRAKYPSWSWWAVAEPI